MCSTNVMTNPDVHEYTVPPEEVVGSFEMALSCPNFGGAPLSGIDTTDYFEELKPGTIKE